MRKILALLLTLSCLQSFAIPGIERWHYEKVTGIRRYPSRNDGTSWFANASQGGMAINPGDTLALRSDIGDWGYVALINYSGTALNPIVIVNEGPTATILRKGFGLESVRFLKIVGNTVPGITYGLRLIGYQEYSQAQYDADPTLIQAKQGFNVTLFSSDIEASYFYVRKGTYGAEIKNDPHPDQAVNDWVLANMYFHHFEMHDLGSQGFYAGNTDPENKDRPLFINGVWVYPRPSRLSNLKIEDGLIDSTGRGGLQISAHEVDNAYVRRMTIRHSGTQLDNQQGANISLGANTKVVISDCILSNSYTWAISSLGVLYLELYNTTIDSTGWLSPTVSQGGYVPLVLATRSQKPEYGIDSSRYYIYNNIFKKAVVRDNGTSTDIYIGNHVVDGKTFFYMGNNISGNSNPIYGNVTITAEPGINYSTTTYSAPSTPPPVVEPFIRTYKTVLIYRGK